MRALQRFSFGFLRKCRTNDDARRDDGFAMVIGGNDGVDFVRFGNAGRRTVSFRAGVSFRNHRSFHCATSASRVPVARASLWLDDDARARGGRVRCDDANGMGWIQTNVSRSFASSSASRTSMRPRGDDDGTRGMRSGSGIDRIKGVSRVGKNPQPGWWSPVFF